MSNSNNQWELKSEDIERVVKIIQILGNPTHKEYGVVFRSLEQFIQDPLFVLNLSYLFVHGNQVSSQSSTANINVTVENRQLAGLLIKNYIFPNIHLFSEFIQSNLKSEILVSLSDTNSHIQNIAAIVYSYLFQHASSEHWEALLSPLMNMMMVAHISIPTSTMSSVLGALKTFKILLEDSASKILTVPSPPAGSVAVLPATTTVTQPFTVTDSNNTNISLQMKLDTLECLNALIIEMPVLVDEPDFMANMMVQRSELAHMYQASMIFSQYINPLIQGLSALASDTQPTIRVAVCRCILLLTPTYRDLTVYQQVFPSLCQFMLTAVLDPVESVALVACEFWGTLVDDDELGDHSAGQSLATYMSSLIPNLIARLPYSEEQLMRERYNAEAENSGDKKLLFRPIDHARGSSGNNSRKEEEELENEWTLRMQAAFVLENIGLLYMTRGTAQEVLQVALPCIEQRLKDDKNVWQRESGMLALGALSKGCMSEMAQYLPSIFSFFITNMSDEMPEMRCISCWVLSRYSMWLLEYTDDDSSTTDVTSSSSLDSMKRQLLAASLHALCQSMLNNNVKVQAAACSAMSTIVENISTLIESVSQAYRDLLLPYVCDIFAVVSQCFQLPYGVKSAMLLIDLVGTLAECLGEELYNLSHHNSNSNGTDSVLTPLYLPFILQRLYSYEEHDMYLFPVLECLTSVTAAVKLDILPYAPELVDKCLSIINSTMSLNAVYEAGLKVKRNDNKTKSLNTSNISINQHKNDNDDEDDDINQEDNEENDVPVKDFAICCFDVLSGICEGLAHTDHFTLLIYQLNRHDMLISLLISCAHDTLPELRQSCLALIGEICKSAPGVVHIPVLQPKLIELLILNMDEQYESCCNNSLWALGELAMMAQNRAIHNANTGEVPMPPPVLLLEPFMGRIVNHLLSLMHISDLNSSLQQNIGVLLGRLCKTNPITMIDLLVKEYFYELCNYMRFAPLNSGAERDQTFEGLVTVLMLQPGILLSDLNNQSPRQTAGGGSSCYNIFSFLLLCATWEDPPDEPLLTQLTALLQGVTHALSGTADSADRWRRLCTSQAAVDAGVTKDVFVRVSDMFRVKLL